MSLFFKWAYVLTVLLAILVVFTDVLVWRPH